MSVRIASAYINILVPPMLSSIATLLALIFTPRPFLAEPLLDNPISIALAELLHNRTHMRSHCVRIASQLALYPFVVIGNSTLWRTPHEQKNAQIRAMFGK